MDQTRRWISTFVVGMNLCPFAKRVFDAGLIRFVVTNTTDEKSLLAILSDELQSLAAASRTEVETTLLIHPGVLLDFFDYNDFFDPIESLIEELELTGEIQIAGFHPDYRFGGTSADAVENYTNRSPYPMLHLLREDSVSEVATDPERMLEIPEQNIKTLKKLGRVEILARLKEVMSVDEKNEAKTDSSE